MRFSTSLTLTALVGAASVLPAAAGTLTVPRQYPTIGGALAAAKPGDTVLVSPKANGTPYYEALTITTPRLSLVGQGSPVIDGTGKGTVVTPFPSIPSFFYTVYPNGVDIQASHVTVSGFTVQNFGFADDGNGPASAINVGQSAAGTGYHDITVTGNTLRGNYNGLTITGYSGSDPYYSGGTYLKGYQVVGNAVTGNSATGASVEGASVLVAGNKITGNGGDGLDATGAGVTVTGNEIGANAVYGLSLSSATYNPSVNDPKNPNPAPTLVALNSIHDNANYGVYAFGTNTMTGNAVVNNVGYGVFLADADYSTLAGNSVSGTTLSGYGLDDGTGLYVDTAFAGLTLSYNQISGSAGDGLFLHAVGGSLVSGNGVTGNAGIGIHLSINTTFGQTGQAGNTVTQNRALHNTVFDARDDASATDDVAYDSADYHGYGVPTANTWARNTFGTSDPQGLSK